MANKRKRQQKPMKKLPIIDRPLIESTLQSAWSDRRDSKAAEMKERRKTARTVGPFENTRNVAVWESCRLDLKLFLSTYMSEIFCTPWSMAHLKAIEKQQQAILVGGQSALAMPRNWGKSRLIEGAALWAALYGHRKFIVCIGATEPASLQLLENMKFQLESNETIWRDWPDTVGAIRALEGIAHRCNGQIWYENAERTHMRWTGKEICLPTIPGEVSSGARVRCVGITGHLRGMNALLRDTKQSIRPDVVLIDDPQTRETAASLQQCNDREDTILGDILGLAGGKQKIAAFLACTVIKKNDVADRFLDRKRHADWQGDCTPMIAKWPDDDKLWKQYESVRRAALQTNPETAPQIAADFYIANRTAMDTGAVVNWEHKFLDGEISALQHAYNLKIDRGESVFAAEFQLNPLDQQSIVCNITPGIVASHLNGQPCYTASLKTVCTTGFIDVNRYALSWAVVSWQNDFTGEVIGYGTWPQDGRVVWDEKRPGQETEGQAIFRNLTELAPQLPGRFVRGGKPAKLDLLMIDAGYAVSRPSVFSFAQRAALGCMVIPSRGRAANYYREGDREGRWHTIRVGDRWKVQENINDVSERWLVHDADYHRLRMHQAWMLPNGSPGGLSLYGDSIAAHQDFSQQICAEKLGEFIAGDTKDFYSWVPTVGVRNDWLDCLTGCGVGASYWLGVVARLRAVDQAPLAKPAAPQPITAATPFTPLPGQLPPRPRQQLPPRPDRHSITKITGW